MTTADSVSGDTLDAARCTGSQPASPGRILVRVPNWIGDCVMALPALRALRHRHPGARIGILTRGWTARLFAGRELADEVMVLPDTWVTPHLGPRLRAAALLPLARSLRERAFDVAVLLQQGFDAALLLYLAGIPVRVGYAVRGRGPLLTQGVPWRPVQPGMRLHPLLRRLWPREAPQGSRHQAYRYLQLLWRSGLVPPNEPQGDLWEGARLPTAAVDAAAAHALLRAAGIGAKETFLLIDPGTQEETARNWLPERYAAVADGLAGRLGLRTLILGWGPDGVLAEEVRGAMRTEGVVLSGEADLGRTLGLIARCRLLLAADSGPMHLAAALGVPQVALFGSTDPAHTGPLSEVATPLFRPAPCSPCYRQRCPLDRRCWHNLGVDEVLEAATDRLEGMKAR